MAINSNYSWFGAVGGSLMSSDIYNPVKDRIHYVLDTRTSRSYPSAWAACASCSRTARDFWPLTSVKSCPRAWM